MKRICKPKAVGVVGDPFATRVHSKLRATVKDVNGTEVEIDLMAIQDALDEMSGLAYDASKPKLCDYLMKLCNGVQRLVVNDI